MGFLDNKKDKLKNKLPMAIKKCDACGRDVSSEAYRCMYCGHPTHILVSQDFRLSVIKISLFIGGLFCSILPAAIVCNILLFTKIAYVFDFINPMMNFIICSIVTLMTYFLCARFLFKKIYPKK